MIKRPTVAELESAQRWIDSLGYIERNELVRDAKDKYQECAIHIETVGILAAAYLANRPEPSACANCEQLKKDVFAMKQSIHFAECGDEDCKEPVCVNLSAPPERKAD